MPPTAALPPRQLTAFDKLYALPVPKLKEGRAVLSERFDEEVQAWADAVGNHDAEEALEHWRAALAISKQIKTVTWVIGIKTYAGV
jgi:hypothetical protein